MHTLIETKWCHSTDNVTALGAWLISDDCPADLIILEATSLQRYYEKPWHYGDEWEQYQAQQNAAAKCEMCQHYVTAGNPICDVPNLPVCEKCLADWEHDEATIRTLL